MEENRDTPPDPQTQPRRFVYRAAEPDCDAAHPLRRATDTPRSFQGLAGRLSPKPMLLKFRVYLKLN
jgi:hypothetical protein